MTLRGRSVTRNQATAGGARRRGRAFVWVAGVASSLLAWGPTGLATARTSTPARDSFSGSITAATGGFSGDRGRVKVTLNPGAGHGARHLKLTIHAAHCPRSGRCIHLTGKLTGTLALGPLRIPDAGRSLTIHATGTIKPLGRVSVAGSVRGSGFIARGRENLQLSLTGIGGGITITAHSRLVPGFTSP